MAVEVHFKTSSAFMESAVMVASASDWVRSFLTLLLVLVFTVALIDVWTIVRRCRGRHHHKPTVDDIEEAVGKKLCLDSTRRAVVRDAAASLLLLVSGQLVGNDVHNRVLLGCKGAGKTLLLKTIHDVVSRQLGAFGLCWAWVDYTGKLSADSPTLQAFKQLGWVIPWMVVFILRYTCSRAQSVKVINQLLCLLGLKLFVVVDEVHNVFMKGCPTGREIIDEIEVIGAGKDGFTHWILSGSSRYLRALITAQHAIDDMHTKGFVHYQKDDINCRKFVPIAIHSFLEAADFDALVKHHTDAARKPPLSAEQIAQLYLITGGIAAYVAALVTNSDAVIDPGAVRAQALGHQGNADADSRILQAVVRAADAHISISQGSTELQTYAKWTSFVDFATVRQIAVAMGVDSTSVERQCHQLSDVNLIRFFTNTNHSHFISLGAPQMMQDLWGDETALSIDEVIALRHANEDNNGDTAVNVALRLIAFAALNIFKHKVFGFTTNRTADGTCCVRELYVGTAAPSVGTTANVTCRVFKELLVNDEAAKPATNTTLGADGVLLTRSSTAGITAHRLQVQMGDGLLDKCGANVVVSRFKESKSVTEEAYRAVGLPLAHQRCILVSLHDIRPEARTTLAEYFIDVWDRRFLADHVWPAHVKMIHPRFAR